MAVHFFDTLKIEPLKVSSSQGISQAATDDDDNSSWIAELSGYIVTALLLAPCFLCVCCHNYLSVPGQEVFKNRVQSVINKAIFSNAHPNPCSYFKAQNEDDFEAAVFTIVRADGSAEGYSPNMTIDVDELVVRILTLTLTLTLIVRWHGI